MKITVIMLLGYNVIWGFGDAQYSWTMHGFNKTMCGTAACEDLIVETVQGKLQGRAFNSVLNKTEYYGFLGIPYAKPPVGELRFQAPQPVSPWTDVYPAFYEKRICEQLFPVPQILRISSEDCLYLNVYTPEVPRKITPAKPVMVSIHGGGFVTFTGSKLIFSPDYLIIRDVIVVTFNYRLSALGFLNLGIPECSGNAGLKDQVFALKWVQQNIAKFGGDPNNVVIIGESAGGASVHYHMLSPMSKGLFHKAIIQSGTALSPWALVHKPIAQAFEIGRRCGYNGNDRKELLQYLKSKSKISIALAATSWIIHYRQVYPTKLMLIGPSVETITDGAFLSDYPLNLIKSATPVPTIFGFNNQEGIFISLSYDNQAIEKVSRNFSLILADNFPVDPKLLPEASMKIKQCYFGDKRVGIETENKLLDMNSDITTYYAYDAIEFLVNSTTPPFVYLFSYEGNLNYAMKMFNMITGKRLKGAAHADDQFYIYHPYIISRFVYIDQKSRRMINIFTTLLTDFAKTGNPSGAVSWKPSTLEDPAYLLIDQQPKMMPGKFHDQRYECFRNTLDPAIKPGTQLYDIF